MDLPKFEHEVFKRTALRTVICQVRYEQVLEIAERAPIDFQGRVKRAFPRIDSANELTIAPFGGQPTQTKSWRFSTKDRSGVLSLAAGAMSLELSEYSEFALFRELLEVGLEALIEAYGVSFFARVGLRYVNEVHRLAESESERVSWANWINPDLLPKVSAKLEADGAFDLLGFLRLTNSDGISWSLRSGIRRGGDESGVWESFTLDSDQFSTEETPSEDVLVFVDSLHDWGWRVFRWAAGTELLARLRADGEPEEGVILGAT